MLAFLFVVLSITAFAEQSAQTNGGDMVNLLEKGAGMMITAAHPPMDNKSPQQNTTGSGQNTTGSGQSGDQSGQVGQLWVRMWFDKLEELEASNKTSNNNRTVVFSIDNLATTDFDLTASEEVDLDSQTKATRFNFSTSLSNGAKLFISVYPKFISLHQNTTGGGNSSESSPVVDRSGSQSGSEGSPIGASGSSPTSGFENSLSGSQTQSPEQSSQSSIQDSPQSSSIQNPPPQSSPVQNSPQQILTPTPGISDADEKRRLHQNRTESSGTQQTILADGFAVPYTALKFSIWLTGWPFADKANNLRLAAVLTCSENGTGGLEGRNFHLGSGFINSKKEAFYDGAKGPVEIDLYHKDEFQGVYWTFSSFGNDLMYDPVFGYSSGAFHILPSITTILLLLMIGLIRS
jgi:hypothetical protein